MATSDRPSWPSPRRQYADGPFGQIHFQLIGEGRPLVLLHQGPMTSGQFDNVYAPLVARGLQAIGIDLPGFGGSDPVPDTPSVADYARVVPAVLDSLGIGQAALLGHHTGAVIAHEAAILFPNRIDSLILNGPVVVTEEERQGFLSGAHLWERDFKPRPHAAHMVELFDLRDRFAEGTIPPERLSDYVVQALVGRGTFWHGHYAVYMYDMAERLKLVRQPTLILTNTGDMIHDHARKAHELRPDFAFVSLDGGTIDIVDQQPEAWADAVAGFLTKGR